MRAFRFGVSAPPLASRADWQERARRLEDQGYAVLLMPDHLGSPSCFAPLVSAAEATTTLRVGTLVANGDFFHPLRLAQEAATVDLLVDGRLELGIGSGWAAPEYALLGLEYRPARARAERLTAAVAEMKRAWAGAVSAGPAPANPLYPPLLIGGQGDTVLRLAAQEADIVGFTGLTWAGSSLRPTGVSVEAVEERVAFVRREAGDRFLRLELNVLVQVAEVTSSSSRAGELGRRWGLDETTVAASPVVLVGDHQHLVDKLFSIRERTGISYFVVFDPAADAMAPVVAELAGR